MTRLYLTCLLVGCLVPTATTASADVKLVGIFGDHMVLQRDLKTPVWGTAEPGEKVTVTLGKHQAEATAGQDAKWMVRLGPMEAGGPLEMTVAGKNTLTLKNVMVGDVWLCAGHSNMGLTVSLAANGKEEAAEANFPNIRQFKTTYVTADEPQSTIEGTWVACSPQKAGGFAAVPYFFAREIQRTFHVPIGLIVTGDVAETLVPMDVLQGDPDLRPILDRYAAELAKWPERKPAYEALLKQWEESVKKAKAEGKPPPGKPNSPPSPGYWRRPSGLYYGTIAPMIPYGIRGVVTYVERPMVYEARKLLPALVDSWRAKWGRGELPFLMAQVANYRPPVAQPGASSFAEFREAQLLTVLKVPNTALAATIDIGDAVRRHPKNKQDVGRRLALAARALAYGEKIVYSGPVYDSMAIEGQRIRLRFKHVGGGLVAKGGAPLKHFAIAGEDKKFVWADAQIDGDSVVVSSDKLSSPVAVRYAWADNPEGCNLYNREGLPAVPFRTDDWPVGRR